MSQTTVKNYFIALDTNAIINLFPNPNSKPLAKQILEYVCIYGPGENSGSGKENVENFLFQLVKNQDVNITLVPNNLETSNRIFFYSTAGNPPFKITGPNSEADDAAKQKIFRGNFHDYAVTMHLTAETLLSNANITFDILIVPDGQKVTGNTHKFQIDPKLKINPEG